MRQCLKENVTTVSWCLALVGLALMGFWLSRGAYFHPLAFGALATTVAFLPLFAAFEVIWCFLTTVFL